MNISKVIVTQFPFQIAQTAAHAKQEVEQISFQQLDFWSHLNKGGPFFLSVQSIRHGMGTLDGTCRLPILTIVSAAEITEMRVIAKKGRQEIGERVFHMRHEGKRISFSSPRATNGVQSDQYPL